MDTLEVSIKKKIEMLGTPLRDWEIQINYGIKTGFNDAFIINREIKDELLKKSSKNVEIIRPILRGRDIKKYKAEFEDIWIINSHNGIKEKNIQRINVKKDYPIIFKHLKNFQQQLEFRQDKGDDWTNLRNCAYLEDLENEKIIWMELTNHANFFLDTNGYYINNTVFFIQGKRLRYLTAFLNSRLCEWYFDKIASTSGAGTRRWIKIYVEQIRIPQIINNDLEVYISEIVDKIQLRKLNHEETIELEREIDSAIYSLFGLTSQEREVIENAEL
jgi:hypothetical protein